VNYATERLWQYAIGTGGQLSVIGVTIITGRGPWSLSVDPTGRYLYVVDFYTDKVSQYLIGANGALTTNSSVQAGLNPTGMVIAH
jgi:6-phosphogluconolactonase